MDFHHLLRLLVFFRVVTRYWWIPGCAGVFVMVGMLWVNQFSWTPLIIIGVATLLVSLFAVRDIVSKPW